MHLLPDKQVRFTIVEGVVEARSQCFEVYDDFCLALREAAFRSHVALHIDDFVVSLESFPASLMANGGLP